MKFVVQLIAIAASAFILELFMPWYGIAFAAFAMGYSLKTKANFLAGFLGIALLWLVKAWLIDASASAPLTEKVAAILTVNKTLLFAITALIGGLIGGFAALSGSLLKAERKY